MYPKEPNYHIAVILKQIKGRTSVRYRNYILNHKQDRYNDFCVVFNSKKVFRFWQRGGGYDRNLWSAHVIHSSINYIEGNPVRSGLVKKAEEWLWSSARARITGDGIVPDMEGVPLK